MAKKKKALKTEGDFFFLILTLCLSIFGTIMVYSASYYHSISKYGNAFHFVSRDGVFKLLGFACFFILANLDYHRPLRFARVALIGGFVLLALLYVIGSAGNNATRWIKIGGFTIMPGEIMKTCFIVFFARYFGSDSTRINNVKSLGLAVAIIGTAAVMIFLQPSLTTAITVAALGFAMLLVAGLAFKWVLAVIAVGVTGGVVLMAVKNFDYMLERIRTAFDPWSVADGDGYQVVQALLALGSGGVLGTGLGKSIQKTLYLPEPENDYILAIIGEELGYVGVIVLMLAYILLLWRIFRIAVRARDSYGMLLASGVGLHIALHVVINIAIVSATFPPTGIILPFISYGGNATILFIAECGMVFNISRYPAEELIPSNALPAAGGAY